MHMAQYQKQLMAAVNVHKQKQERFTAVAKAQWKESSEKRERLRTFGLRAMVPPYRLEGQMRGTQAELKAKLAFRAVAVLQGRVNEARMIIEHLNSLRKIKTYNL